MSKQKYQPIVNKVEGSKRLGAPLTLPADQRNLVGQIAQAKGWSFSETAGHFVEAGLRAEGVWPAKSPSAEAVQAGFEMSVSIPGESYEQL